MALNLMLVPDSLEISITRRGRSVFHHDPALDEALLLPRGMVFRVLAQIAMGPRLRDRLDDDVALHILELVQLFLQVLEACRSSEFFHRRFSSGKKRL